ncbi:hypothetical protein LZL87_014081 [Fusarium oxysporum]|nr:hypothetical protein LZL87_014081 [Fusarium oxysporum]
MDPIEGGRRFPNDALPPEGDYTSREKLYVAINAWAASRGYAFVTKNSWKTSSGRTGVIFSCDRGGRAPRPKERQRQTTSRYTGCPFSIIAMESLYTIATQQDIYNCIARGKRELAKGQSHMHALANELESEGFWSQIRLNETGRATAVFFAHPKSLEYAKLYPEVLILDCTYKTNKYKMPQLDMVGVDACQRSFCVVFAFLGGEEEAHFIWALGRLRYIYELHGAAFPSVILTDRCLACINAVSSPSCFPESALILCLWHINKAVLGHCMPAFARDKDDSQGLKAWKEFYDSWHEIVALSTEDIYNARLEKFMERYLPDYVSEVGYIIETWMDPHKERFVKAWVHQYMHFDQLVTSRAEGIHRLIKAHLKSSQIDLFEAWRVINLVLLNQLAEIEAAQARQQITKPLYLSGYRESSTTKGTAKVFEMSRGRPQDELKGMPLALRASIAGPYPSLYDHAYNNTYIYSLYNTLIIPGLLIRLYYIRDYHNNPYDNTHNNNTDTIPSGSYINSLSASKYASSARITS